MPDIKYRVWSDLSLPERSALLGLIEKGNDPDSVAVFFGLKPSSLSRKIRKINAVDGKGTEDRVAVITAEKEKRVMVYSDAHFPTADPLALACAIEIRKLYNPEVIINLGDTLDMYHLSRFSKSGGRKETLQGEIDAWTDWATEFYEEFAGESYIVKGNHDSRLERTASSVPGLGNLSALGLDSILSASKFGCEFVSDLIIVNPRGDELYPDGDMYFYHGDSARKGSGSSVRAMSERMSNASFMIGHSHRTAVVVSRSSRGPVKSYEVGCLSSLKPEWTLYPDWSQSVMIGVLSERFCDFSPVVIDRGKFLYNGAMRYCDGWKRRER